MKLRSAHPWFLPLALALAAAVTVSSADAQQQQRQPSRTAKTGKDHLIRRLELKQSKILDAARLLAELSGLNIVATDEAGKKEVTLYLQDVRAIDAIEMVAKVSGLWYREDEQTGTIRLLTTEEYQKDLVVFRDDITKVFTMLHPNAVSVAVAIQDLYRNRVLLSLRAINDDDLMNSGGGGGGFGGGFGGGGGGGLGNTGFGGQGTGSNNFGTGGGTGGFGAFGGGFGNSSFGSGFGGAYGNGQFSRPTGGSQVLGFGFGGFPGGNFGSQPSSEPPLTSGQIEELERRLKTIEGQTGTGVASELVREITQREPPIYVTINRQHNLVIVRTSDADAMKAIERLVLEIDRPTPEVLLEMKILQVRIDDNYRSIFDLQFASGTQGPTAANQVNQNPFLQNAATAAQNVLGTVNAPIQGGTLVYQFLNDHIRARIELLEQNNRLDTVATPLLLASNNRPARIFVGEERVLTTGVSTAVVTPGTGAVTTAIQPTTEVRDIGTTLILVPKINADRTVTLFLSQDSSSVNPASANIPVPAAGGGVTSFPVDTVNTANIQGTVVAKDGLTVAIGGLIQETVSTSVQQVPVLGRLPVVGQLFRREVDVNTKTELVLLITPHVIMTPAEGEYKTHWRIKELSDHPYVHPNEAAALPPDEYYVPNGAFPPEPMELPPGAEVIPPGRLRSETRVLRDR